MSIRSLVSFKYVYHPSTSKADVTSLSGAFSSPCIRLRSQPRPENPSVVFPRQSLFRTVCSSHRCFLVSYYASSSGTGFLYLYYYTRNSETTPSESYPVAAAPVVNHYASFKLSLPSRRKLDWPYQYYVEKLTVWANAMHKISSTRTSFITRSFLPLSEAELVRISGFNMTEYVEYCRQYGMFA